VRELLRETVGANSFWTDAELLLYANLVQDRWAMQLMETHEGWFVDRFETNLVAEQAEYTIPEGTDRIRRILLAFPDTDREVPVPRAERYGEASPGGAMTYRIVGELCYLTPAPGSSRTNGLVFEVESLPARLVADDDKLDLKWPSMFETILTLGVWDMACGIEDAQGNIDPQVQGRLMRFQAATEATFASVCEVRSSGRIYSTPFHLGD